LLVRIQAEERRIVPVERAVYRGGRLRLITLASPSAREKAVAFPTGGTAARIVIV
jgi:hypothetical protein